MRKRFRNSLLVASALLLTTTAGCGLLRRDDETLTPTPVRQAAQATQTTQAPQTSQLQSELAATQLELDAKENEIKTLQEQNAQLDIENDILLEDMAATTRNMNELAQKREQETNEQIAALQKERDGLQSEKTNLQTVNTSLASAVSELDRQVTDFRQELTGRLLPDDVYVVTYAIRDARSAQEAEELGRMSGEIAQRVVLAYNGDATDLTKMGAYLRGRGEKLSSLGIEPEYSMLFDTGVTTGKLVEALDAINAYGRMPSNVILFDAVGRILEGRSRDIDNFIVRARQYGVTPILDVNPDASSILSENNRQADFDQVMGMLKREGGAIAPFASMYALGGGDFYDRQLANDTQTEIMAEHYGVPSWNVVMPNHDGHAYDGTRFPLLVDWVGDGPVIVNSLDEKGNGSAMTMEAYAELKQ